jgi:TonB family protein
VNEPLDRLIAERQRLDRGLPATVLVSLAAHLGVAGLAVALPRGGGGSPTASAPPAAAAAPQPAPVASAAPPPPPQVQKPPTEAPRPRALPLPDSRRSARRALEPPPVPSSRSTAPASSKTAATTPGGVAGGRGTASATPGLELGPPGPGVPDGTDSGGDWYLAGVQQKIWMLWNQQLKSGFTQPVGVTFTILPDGNVTGVRVTQPSGASLLDMAAQRAVLNAAPFGPLPKEYGQNPRTIQALFKPSQ